MKAENSAENSKIFSVSVIGGQAGIIPDHDSDYINRGIKKMSDCGKPLYLRVQNLLSELGGGELKEGIRRAAPALGVSEAMVYKYAQNPDVSGCDIPVKHLTKLLALAVSDGARDQNPIDEVISFFAMPARRRIVRESALDDLLEVVAVVRGERDGPVKRSVATGCPECGDQLMISGEINGVRQFSCRTCSMGRR